MKNVEWKNVFISVQIIFLIVLSLYLMQKYYPKIQNFIVRQATSIRWLVFILIGFIGSMSIILPISPPYPAIVFFLSTYIHNLNPFELAFFTGIGASLGESTAWFLGDAFFSFLPKKYKKRAMAIENLLKENKNGEAIILFLVFIFGLTPLPDDIMFLILGFIKYSLVKSLFFCFLGKFLLLYTIAEGGNIIGNDLISKVSDTELILGSIVGTIITLILVLGIDWDKLVESVTKNTNNKLKARSKKK